MLGRALRRWDMRLPAYDARDVLRDPATEGRIELETLHRMHTHITFW